MDLEFRKSSDGIYKLLRLLKMTADVIDDLDDYINNITATMMEQSLTGYIGRANVLAQCKCAALGMQNMYFMYYEKIQSYMHGDSNSRVNSYTVPNNSQVIGYINKVMCIEFNSETRSC